MPSGASRRGQSSVCERSLDQLQLPAHPARALLPQTRMRLTCGRCVRRRVCPIKCVRFVSCLRPRTFLSPRRAGASPRVESSSFDALECRPQTPFRQLVVCGIAPRNVLLPLLERPIPDDRPQTIITSPPARPLGSSGGSRSAMFVEQYARRLRVKQQAVVANCRGRLGRPGSAPQGRKSRLLDTVEAAIKAGVT